MDGLRPEVDELDRFKNRSNSKTKVDSAKGRASESVKKSEKPRSTFSFTLFVLLFICSVAAFSWFSWQQHIEISLLKSRLSDASGFMDRSKLLIARLEGKLSETGVELAETGTAAEKKLAFLDSEMRKLWGVAYDRNKKAIETNQELLERLDTKLSGGLKEQNVSIKNASKDIASLSESLKKYESQLGSLSNELSVLRTEQEIVSSDIKERLNAQKKILDDVKKDSKSYLEKTAKYDLSIESINASRRQLNERIVELDKKINALQLKNSPTTN